MSFLYVALGGALGACLRYAISLIPYHGTFPLLTFVTNILGAILIGIVVGMAKTQNAQLFLKTGVCGGFTTFSTFSLEAYKLLQDGKTPLALLYAAASVAGCIAGVWLGMKVKR